MALRLVILLTFMLFALVSGRVLQESASAGGSASGGSSATVSAKSETSVAENGDSFSGALANAVGEWGAGAAGCAAHGSGGVARRRGAGVRGRTHQAAGWLRVWGCF